MTVTILKGDCRDVLATLPAESVHCVVTSPPYFGLRDYGVAGQIGLERQQPGRPAIGPRTQG
jgi:DNA modification methylase